ncbi:hypothetical protein [Streptosporangium saharense]
MIAADELGTEVVRCQKGRLEGAASSDPARTAARRLVIVSEISGA